MTPLRDISASQRATDSKGCGIARPSTLFTAIKAAAVSYARPLEVPSAFRPNRAPTGSAGGLLSAQPFKVMTAELK